jgi:hypothetical protein
MGNNPVKKYVQLGLFDDAVETQANLRGIKDWPNMERFPYNFRKNKVEQIVLQDLTHSNCPLIITGFTSLDYIIDFVAGLQANTPEKIRLLLGSEPSPARRAEYSLKKKTFPQEVTDYWLNAGISLRLCYKIVLIMEMIRDGRLQSRYIADDKHRLHSKIYVADKAITVGSSNFSYTGMRKQLEANARFQKAKEPKRYREASLLAENFWRLGEDYNSYLLELLQQLLKVVSWQEALGRACGELLEGEWAEKYIKTHMASSDSELWPSQKAGIAQSLWMVENIGSVLVADATGSGKTRMGAHLLRAVMDRIWSTGRVRKDITALVCPPRTVEDAWSREAAECGLPLKTLSHGILSHRGSDKHEDVVKIIRRAQCLAIDEAHNFLNPNSSRTRGLHGNMADVVVMFTATPINKGVRDLLRIVDLLGADNLEDSALALFHRLEKRMKKQSGQVFMKRDERLEMQKEVQRFTLRRTKSMFNLMVDQDPDSFCDDRGIRCRYPEHRTKTYPTGEDLRDQQLAEQIRELAGQLKGLVNLKSGLDMPEYLQGLVDEKIYVRGRLQGAKGLALYNIMSRLRSSKAALVEHLLGTEEASRRFGIKEKIKSEETGNVFGGLKESVDLIQPSSLHDILPGWLTDPEEHREAVIEEAGIYEKILNLTAQMSDLRERSKAEQLSSALSKHSLVIAFDSCLITLEVIKNFISEESPGCEVIVATGAKSSNRKKVNTLFSLGSDKKNVIALCSDAMSEGLNLQQASAVLLLDMPSVIRIAEQRVGRVDRMNSPHKYIDVWWPQDSESFSLKADRKFFQRYTEVKEILGSNLPLPENLIPEGIQDDGPSTAEEMINRLNELERAGQVWDGIQDAFQPVRDLVDHEKGIVPEDVYKDVCHSKARVVSTVSLIRSQKAWAFFAVSGIDRGAPKWLLLDHLKAQPITHLDEIAVKLRGLLSDKIESRAMDKTASRLVDDFLNRILETEKSLLPRKKQRALKEMELVLGHYQKQAESRKDRQRIDVVKDTRKMLDIPSTEQDRPDLDAVAEAWLDLIRETWYERLMQRRRFKPLRLKDIRKDLRNKPIDTEKITAAFNSIPLAMPIHNRVVSAIIGVPD